MSTNLDTILAFLQGKGLTPAQAAGVAGNLQVESGFDPTAANPKEGAIGIAQWEGGRRKSLDSFAASIGGSETDLGVQLNYLWNELQGPESSAYAALTSAQDPAAAASAFDQYYERSSGSTRTQRVSAAQKIASGTSVNSTTSNGSTGSAGSGTPGSVASRLGGGLFSGWAPTAFTIGMKVLGAGAAAGLVIVGAVHTVSSK